MNLEARGTSMTVRVPRTGPFREPFTCEAGMLTILTGPSGSGKSILQAQIVLTLHGARAGRTEPLQEIGRSNEDVYDATEDLARALRKETEDGVTAAEEVGRMLRAGGVEGARLEVERPPDAESLPTIRLRRRGQPAGGKATELRRQGTGLGRAVSLGTRLAERRTDPDVVSLTNPTSGMDAGLTRAVAKTILAACARGTRVVLSTHDQVLMKELTGPAAGNEGPHPGREGIRVLEISWTGGGSAVRTTTPGQADTSAGTECAAKGENR